MISVNHNKQTIDLFEKSSSDCFFGRAPMIYDELSKSDILFVGVNPSFIDTDKSLHFVKINCMKNDSTAYLSNLKKSNFEALFYDLDSVNSNIKTLGDIHKVFRQNYSYFKKFNHIADQLNVTIEHLDLLPVRETSQKLVVKLLSQNQEFTNACFDIFLSALKQISPKAIIIENSFIRDLLINSSHPEIRNYFPSYDFKSFKSSDVGTPINKYGMAVYYTSMLTGQRAIDLGSYNRLIWSLNKFLK
jgi:hypothetical protein